MSEALGFGVIGTGFMGRTWAGVIDRQVDDARLVAVAGGSRAAQLAADHGVAALGTDELLGRPDVEAVVVATPVPTHRPLVVAAATAGKHVIVEKPMTGTVADAEAMVAAAAAAGVRLAIVSQHRFRAAPKEAKRLIDDGRIGRIRMIRVTGPTAGWDVPTDSWQADRSQVSPYADWGAHACDLVRWLSGSEAVTVFAQFATYTDIPPVEQSAMAQYRLGNGVLVQVWMTYEIPPPGLGSAMQILLTGSDGMIDLDSYGAVRLASPTADWVVAFRQPPFDPLNPDDPVRLGAYADELRDFIGAIREGREPLVNGREGVLTTAMLEAAEHSAASGQAVRLPLEVGVATE
ncbi:MAG TPA: Gfo/Idh/MocA family oxidoreductase [Candidatus Limnocylindrales bacterium]|jgi:predicted dehydrogenase|nr:Gfo/Idh/MocA family oxidoreductase [Candidatus Limnocylindrales bacterium]